MYVIHFVINTIIAAECHIQTTLRSSIVYHLNKCQFVPKLQLHTCIAGLTTYIKTTIAPTVTGGDKTALSDP